MDATFIFEPRHLDNNYVAIADGLLWSHADDLRPAERFDREIYAHVMVDLITDDATSLPDRLIGSLASFGLCIDIATAAEICHLLMIPPEYNSDWHGQHESLRPNEI